MQFVSVCMSPDRLIRPYLVLGYAFFVFRLLHSVIHCTYNRVLHRFYSYSVASLALWAMIILAMIDTIRL
ncbi:MAPEG family protein [Thiohalophilus sp.]|uniref:MAPEG family protein n=1 Tax=Thiohalophilus sp. TaxID=3028392 RepID=UPI003975E72E